MRTLTKSEQSDLHDAYLAELEVTRQGIISFATRPLEIMFDYKPSGYLEGKPVEILIPERHRQVHKTVHQETFWKNPEPRMMGRQMKLVGRKSDGSEFPIEVLLMPKTVEGRDIILALVLDMSGRTNSS